VSLTFISVHENSAAAAADIIRCVTANVPYGRGTDHRTACASGDQFHFDYGMMIHPNCSNGAQPFFKQPYVSW
jgi:hypothetical protein